jgi:O-acetyl-ADP-ribose deacetylase (regulator of RNase III)
MKIVHGDLVALAKAGEFDVIIHGCNCCHLMRSGIAKTISAQYIAASDADFKTVKGDHNKLGNYSSATVNGVTIINAYTQYNPGMCPRIELYETIDNVFGLLSNVLTTEQRIGIPRIGAGIAGGSWNIISGIIKKHMHNHNITLVEFTP